MRTRSTHGPARRGARLVAASVIALVCVGCGTGQGNPGGTRRVVDVTERDFKITAPRVIAAGDLTLRIDNRGPDAHELIVVRLDRAPLPLRSDGLTIDEDALAHREPGSLEPADGGAVRLLPVHLTPGRYILFCNMSGHYMAGMHTVVVVR